MAKKQVKEKKAGKMYPVVHFEMPTNDRSRTSKFYSKVFGWNMAVLGEEHGNYLLATTGETKKNGMLKRTNMINGGFYEKHIEAPAQYPTVVIAVDSLKQMMKKVAKEGGEILGEPHEIPGYGTYVSFYDTEGNRVEMIEPTKEMKQAEKKRKR